jgi:hypothetical protein
MEGDVDVLEIHFCTQRDFCVDVLDQSSMKMSVEKLRQSGSRSELAGYDSWAMTGKNVVE